MKKRLVGLILVMSLVLGASLAVFADGDGPPTPRPPRSISVELNEANELSNIMYEITAKMTK